MENSNVKENLEVLFEKFRNMIKVETVVGEAVQIGDTTLVPFVDVTFGFGTGTNHNTAKQKTTNVAAVAAVPKWNQALSSLSKGTALSCSTLRAILTAAASIVLSVWYLISCPN